jgi:hypothetical protein
MINISFFSLNLIQITKSQMFNKMKILIRFRAFKKNKTTGLWGSIENGQKFKIKFWMINRLL